MRLLVKVTALVGVVKRLKFARRLPIILRPAKTAVCPMPTTQETAFTMVELIVVLVIVLTLGGIAATSMRGGQDTAREQSIRVSALAVDDAIKDFRRDHGSRVPIVASSSTEWPLSKVTKGPVDRQGKPYMRKRGDQLALGEVGIVTSTSGGGKYGRLRYVRDASNIRNYTLLVEQRSGSAWKQVCWLGTKRSSDTNTGLKRC